MPPGREAARQFRAAFSPFLQQLKLPVDARDGFLLAISELITNLGRHPDPLPENIRVTFSRTQGAWQLEVADDGPPFDDLETMVAKNLNYDDLHESGMGLQLVRERFPDFQYLPRPNADNGWNRMIITRPVSAASRSHPEILVVDDDPVFLKVIDGYLRQNFVVVGLNSVADALAHLERGSTALIISDIHMPGTDGYDFRRQVQQFSGTAELPFILLTGSSSEADREMAIDLSIDDYLTKPVNKRQLVATIHRILKRTSDVRNRIGDRLDAEITSALEPRFGDPPSGYSVAVAFQAAAPGGGDLLIERKLDDGHLIVLADIMGHGEQAKFFAHVLNGFVYGAVQGLSTEVSPGNLLRALSDLFSVDKILSQSLATALVLVVDADGGINMAAAGHPPPLILRDGGIHEIEVGGPLLGLMESAHYSEHRLHLTHGERLLLYTDGISEAGRHVVVDPSELLDMNVEEALTVDDEDIVSGMLRGARSRAASELEDDATAIILRRHNG